MARDKKPYDYTDDDGMEINPDIFDKDFDEVGFDPEYEDDSDDDAADLFGY